MKLKQIVKILIICIITIILASIILFLNKKESLPYDYKLWYENKEIVFGKKIKNNSFIIVSKNIKEISFDHNYILIKKEDQNKNIYCLIDIKNNRYTDNINEKELKTQITKLKINKIKWYKPKEIM